MTEGGDPKEIELTLRLEPGSIPRLLRAASLKPMLAGRKRTQRLQSTYYDTPDLRLHRHRMALRVRRVGDSFMQTLKTARGRNGSSITRGEWEKPVAGARPELSGSTDKHVRRVFDERVLERLEPVFETDIQRSVIPLAFGGAEIELSLDVGEIRTPKGNVAVCEAEIELKAGGVASVYEVADAVRRAVPAAIEPLSKSERAFALMAPGGPQARGAEPIELPAEVDVADAFLAIARGCLVQLRANAAAVLAGDSPEAMHQLRVALRRLRSAFAAFGAMLPARDRRRFARELKTLADSCGRAREIDVFLDEILAAARRRLRREPALVAVRAAAGSARAAAWARARRVIASPRFTDTVLALEAWLETGAWRIAAGEAAQEPALAYARRTLRRLHRKLTRHGGEIAGLDEPALHEIRLQAKKLRYGAEFFGSLFAAKAARRYVAALAAVQEHLGILNDGATVRHVLEAVAPRRRAASRDEFDHGAALVLGWSAARVAAEIERLPKTWSRFLDTRPFWK